MTAAPARELSAILTAPASKLDGEVIFELRRLHREVGIPDLIRAWEAEDRANADAERVKQGKRPIRGGRPAALDAADVLVIAHALLLAGEDALLTSVAEAYRRRLRPDVRRLFGLPEREPEQDCDRYSQVQSRFQHLDNLVNPNPGVAGRRRMPEEYWAMLDALEEEGRLRRQARAITLSNLIIEVSIRVMPQDVYDRWNGDICIDATAIRVHGRRGSPAGFSNGTQESGRTLSAEPDAYWYVRKGDHKGNGPDKAKYAYEAHLAVISTPTGDNGRTLRDLAYICVGMTLDAPGFRIAEHAHTLVRSITERGHRTGEMVTDNLYLPMQAPDKLQRPIRAYGYEPVFAYPEPARGHQATVQGALLVDGSFYSPAMPDHLITATEDHVNELIDSDELAKRIEARRPFLLQLKQSPDRQGRFGLACPAAGKAPTVACGRYLDRSDAPRREGRRSLPLAWPRQDATGAICRQDSVTFDFSDDTVAKYYQKYQYLSEEWRRHYEGPRSIVESYNGFVKDAKHGRVDETGLRRVRGYGKQLLVIALMISTANIRLIKSFLRKEAADAQKPPADPTPASRRARRSFNLADLVQPNAPPLSLPGHPRPSQQPAA